MKWSEKGDSFIVVDSDKFMQLLPLYFKTCNYSSFVRQLNMYDFHKIKSLKNHQEFKHPMFHRHKLQDLSLIRRKKVVPIIPPKEKSVKAENPNIEMIRAELEFAQQQLCMVKVQNSNLVRVNKDMMGQLRRFKNVMESKMQRVFYMLFVMLNQFDNELAIVLERPLKSIGIWIDLLGKHMSQEVVSQIFYKINDILATSTPYSITIVDQLMDCFYKYYTHKNPNFVMPENDWKQFFETVIYKRVTNPVFHDNNLSIMASPSHLNLRVREIYEVSIRNSLNPSIYDDKAKSGKSSIFKKNLIDLDDFDMMNMNTSLLDSPTLPHFNIASSGQQFKHGKWTDDAGLDYNDL